MISAGKSMRRNGQLLILQRIYQIGLIYYFRPLTPDIIWDRSTVDELQHLVCERVAIEVQQVILLGQIDLSQALDILQECASIERRITHLLETMSNRRGLLR
jgi:hypothetical protein